MQRNRLLLSLLAATTLVGSVSAIASVGSAAIGAPSPGPAGPSTLAAQKAKAKAVPVVGSVSALGGTKKLQLQAGEKGAKRTIKLGAKLRLGDQLILGKGVTATIKLTRPKSVPEGTTLVLIRSISGSSHKSKVSRKGRTTTIVVTPVKAAKKK